MCGVKFADLLNIYENEIKKGVKNKKRINKFELNKMMYLTKIKDEIENNTYDGGKHNLFVIYKPKTRLIMSQNVYDKIINHYVARYFLEKKVR